MDQALIAGRDREGCGPGVFAAFSGGRNRYDSGSHIDVDGVNILGGAAWGCDLEPGHITLAAFAEAGHGNYDTHNSFDNAPSVHGKGDVDYYGGGILGRMDFTNGFHVEASARMGRVESDFRTDDLTAGAGNQTRYDSDSDYYGLHAGLGYTWRFNDAAGLDLYTRYIWTRQGSDNVTVHDEPVHFDAADSHRWRSGVRFSYALTERVTPYIGAAYDHEFDGKVGGHTRGVPVDAPDLEGGTGMLELGLTAGFLKGAPLTVEFGARGYTGIREGVGGMLTISYEF